MAVEDIRPISESEVLEKLSEKLSKEELDYNEQLMAEHSSVLKKIGADPQVVEKLKGLNLPDEVAVKLADVMPKSPETVSLILSFYDVAPEEQLVSEILKITKGE